MLYKRGASLAVAYSYTLCQLTTVKLTGIKKPKIGDKIVPVRINR